MNVSDLPWVLQRLILIPAEETVRRHFCFPGYVDVGTLSWMCDFSSQASSDIRLKLHVLMKFMTETSLSTEYWVIFLREMEL